MSKLSFIDKLGVLLELSKSSKLYIVVLIILLFLGIALITTNKNNEKIRKTIYLIVTIAILIFVLLSYYSSIGKMIKYMMDNFFIAVFFPNLAIYLAAMIATNIILWISIFHYKTANPVKIVNVIIYVIMNYLFALLLNVFQTEGIDIFSQSAVYENKSSSAIISLSSTIFIVWIVFLVIYKILLTYLRKDFKPKVKKVIVKRKVKKLPENYMPVDYPDYIYSEKKQKTINQTAEEKLTKELESMFTLDDYKLLLKMLNEQKQKEKQQQEEKQQQIQEVPSAQDELKRYNELLELYKMH